jgi:hypothetical protein
MGERSTRERTARRSPHLIFVILEPSIPTPAISPF